MRGIEYLESHQQDTCYAKEDHRQFHNNWTFGTRLNPKEAHFSFAVSIVLFTLLIAITQQAISPFGTAVSARLFSDSAFCHWSTDQHGPKPEHMLLFQASQLQSIKGNQVQQEMCHFTQTSCYCYYTPIYLILNRIGDIR